MARSGFLSNWKNAFSISFGLLYVLFLAWLIFRTSMFVPEGQENYWTMVFISYAVLNTLILSNAKMRDKLFNVSFLNFLPRFLLFFAIALFLFYFLLSNYDFMPTNLFNLLSGIPWWLAVIHALVFATTESVIWQGYLDDVIGRPASWLVAGIFHWGVWTGGALIVIPSAALLFALFSWVHWRFKSNSNDLAPVIATHTAFNLIKLGFMFKPF